MEFATRIRLGLAMGIVLSAVSGIVLAGTVEAGDPAPPLQPDLTTVDPGASSIYMKRSKKKGKAALRIANRVANEGAGPLELFAQPATNGGGYACDPGEEAAEPDQDAYQRIFADTNGNGIFDRGSPDDGVSQEVKVGCFEYHAIHDHWHLQDFARFVLRDRKTDDIVAGPSRKIGFCIIDSGGRVADLDGSPPAPHYPVGGNAGCGQGNPAAGPGGMGLSVGYSDIYTASTPGQRLVITGVTRGRYCLVSTANPPNGNSDIEETDQANNDRRRVVKINPERRRARYTGQTC